MVYKTVIFDLDGTLLDTLEDLCDSTNFALAHFGFPTRSLAEVRSFVGNGIGKLIERALPENAGGQTYGAVLAEFKRHYAENCNNKTCLYVGIEELLRKLAQSGVKLAVVSNKVDSAVRELCEKYFGALVPVAIGEREGVRRKPAPDSVFAAMELLGAKKEETVYVGDSEVDIETAKNAGIELIAVSWGFRGRELLESLGARKIADSAKELEKMLLE